MGLKYSWKLFGTLVLGLGALLMLLSFYSYSESLAWVINMRINLFSIDFSFMFDGSSLLFGGLVSIISGSIFIYSLSYMETEVFFNRFMLIVVSFISSMLFLIFSNNMFQLVLGWDGLGITSYFLVIYYNTFNSSNAGMITLMINRIGDVGVILLIYSMMFYNWSLFWVSCSSAFEGVTLMVLLLGTASTKSAQIPFSAWLPAAMAAPTPVSSLVHSSTLVTAGIYMVYRLIDCFSEDFKICMMLLGGLTSLMASLSAMFEVDMKKIVALSTLSHLGLMLVLMAFDEGLGFMHLCYHAFFKALLFMAVGLWIHGSNDYQDMLKVSNLYSISKVNSVFSVVGGMSLCGLPFLTGFYSKDVYLELILFSNFGVLESGFYFMILLTSFLYSLRFLWFTICNFAKLMPVYCWGEDNRLTYHYSMIILMGLSVIFGMLSSEFMNLNLSLFMSSSMKIFMMTMMVVSIFVMWHFVKLISSNKIIFSFMSSLGFIYSLSRIYPVFSWKFLGNMFEANDKNFVNVYSGGYLNQFQMAKLRKISGKINQKLFVSIWIMSGILVLAL